MKGEDSMSKFLEDTGNEITIGYWKDPSTMPHSHTHPQYEVYFCTKNVTQKSVINGVEYVCKYPCVIISTPYTIHSMSCDETDGEDFERFVFYFDEKTLRSFDPHLIPDMMSIRNSGLLFRLSDEQAEQLKSLILTVNGKTTSEKELLLALFLNKLYNFKPVEPPVRIGISLFYIQDVLQYIAEHFCEQINSATVSQKFAISRSKLDRDFKRFTGSTVHSFLDNCRLNHAKSLILTRKDLSIGEIAAMSGFSSETYFFPYFKSHTGCTPNEYKNRSLTASKRSI